MKSDQFWTAVSKALTTLTVMLIVTVVLASGAAAYLTDWVSEQARAL